MDIGLMVEGQNGLNWAHWTHIYQLAERLKFPSLFRSDHYFIGDQQDVIAVTDFADSAPVRGARDVIAIRGRDRFCDKGGHCLGAMEFNHLFSEVSPEILV